MDSNIVKFVDQKYQFNRSAFKSLLSESKFGKRLAVISLIGENLKFLNNIKNINHSEDTNYFINLYSKPILLQSSDEKTEVFLIYSNTSIRHFNCERLLVDTYGVFLNFSSTVLLQFEKIIQREELLNFEKIVEFHSKIKGRNKSFNELLIIVLDWDPNRPQYREKDYLFGRKNGQKYFINEFKDTKLKEYFKFIKCFLLPSDQSKYYQTNLDQLNEQMLFNVDEMKVVTNEDLKSEDFISLFEDHIQSLNDRHFDDCLGLIDLKLVPLSEPIIDNQCNEQVSLKPSVSSGDIYQENESLNGSPSEQTTYKLIKSVQRKVSSTNLQQISLEVSNFEKSTNFRKDSFVTNSDNFKIKVNNEIQFKDSINYPFNKNISEIEDQKERLPGLPGKQANNLKEDIKLYCDELIEVYKEISDKIHLQSNERQLSIDLYNLRSDIIKKLNTKFFNADQAIFDGEKKKFQDKITLMENQIRDQFNNSKVLFDKCVSDYKTFIENEIKTHFSSNDSNLIKIDLFTIHINYIQGLFEKLCNQNEIFNETWLNELKSRINEVYNYYGLIADSLNNYVEEWMKLIGQSYVMNSDTEFERLDKQFYEKNMININNMKDQILSSWTNQLVLVICSKVKHCLQQIISQKSIKSEYMFEEKLGVYDKMIKQIFENNIIAILSEEQFFEKQEMAVTKTILEQCQIAINSFDASSTLKMKILESDLLRKRKQYVGFIITTRSFIKEWNKQLMENKQIEPTINQDIILQINIITDILPDNSFFLNIFNQIFESFKAKSNEISMSEQRISSNIIKTINESFEIWINYKLKNNFYEKTLFDSYTSKLIQYSLDSLRKNVNYLSQNRDVLFNLETNLMKQLSLKKDSIYCEYEERIKQVKTFLNEKRGELIIQIRKAISNEYPDNCFKNQAEFETNSKSIIEMIFSKTLKSMGDFDSFFTQEFKQLSLFSELKNSVEKDINNFMKTFQKLELPEPKMSQVQINLDQKIQDQISHQNLRKPQCDNQPLLKPFKTTVAKRGNINPDPLTTIKPFASQRAPLYSSVDNLSLITLFGPTFLYSVFPKQYGHYFEVNNDNIDTRPNKILVADKIYCGKSVDKIDTNFNLNLLKLLQIRDLKKEEDKKKYLKKYSQNLTDNLTVKFNAINEELSIESMIALQVLDIKFDAEKDGINKVNKAVFIVPTHFTIKQLCDFKNVGKITGLDDSCVNVITQISCAAIGFAEKLRKNRVNTTQNVLFIALNEYKCDLAVCCLHERKIMFKRFSTQNLINTKQIVNEQQVLPKIISNFRDSLKTMEKDYNNFYSIQSVILIGFSDALYEIEKQIKCKFQYKYEENIDHVKLILEGAAYFAQSYRTQQNLYKIIDITKQTFEAKFKFVSRSLWGNDKKLFVRNTEISTDYPVQFSDVKAGDLPVTVKIYEGQFLVAIFSINTEIEWKRFNLLFKFTLNEKQNLSLEAKCVTNDRQEKTLFVEESMLDNSYIEHQREIVMKIPKSLWDRSTQTNNHLDAKNKLENLCEEMRAKIEQVQLSIIIKASITDSLNEALNLLKSNNFNRDSYEKHFKSLETLKKSFLK